MREISKILSVFINIANYAAGFAVAVILLFKLDFISVFYIMGMTSNESLFFNMLMFQIGLVLIGLVLVMMTSDRKKKDTVIEFPLFYEFKPIIISGISIYYAFTGDTQREKIAVIAASVLYSVFSAIIIYSGSRIFQIFPKEK